MLSGHTMYKDTIFDKYKGRATELYRRNFYVIEAKLVTIQTR